MLINDPQFSIAEIGVLATIFVVQPLDCHVEPGVQFVHVRLEDLPSYSIDKVEGSVRQGKGTPPILWTR